MFLNYSRTGTKQRKFQILIIKVTYASYSKLTAIAHTIPDKNQLWLLLQKTFTKVLANEI